MKRLISLAAGILLIFSFERLDVFQEHSEGMLGLPPEKTVGQTFVAKHDNLSMINLLNFDNPGLSNKDNLVFHLREYFGGSQKEGEDLATITFNGANIGEHSILRLKFSPLPHSANRKFYFYIENIEEVFEKEPMTEILKIGYAKQDFYKEGSLIYDGQKIEGDLAFRTFYSVYPHQFIVESLRDFLARFWQDKLFLFFYVFVIAFLLFLVCKS